jgi:RNA polymerase sigma-70 factor (ECF subfamily)
MDDSSRPDCAALLAHAGWVRGLARHLVADAHAADDVAQDALVAALAGAPARRGALAAWLAGVVRNLARLERRRSANRGARERVAARVEADDVGAQLLERLEAHREVVEVVGRLGEPYRTAILLRYFEGLAPAEIAARTGAPLRTVHTRLQRALARLRADLGLGRAHESDGPAWLPAWVPLAAGTHRWSAAATGALLVDAKLKIALVLVAVLALGASTLTLLTRAPEPSRPATELAAAATALDAAKRSPLEPSAEGPRAPARIPVAAPAVSAAASTETPVPGRVLRGRVIDVERAPVAGIRVRNAASGAHSGTAVTDAGGAFELERIDVAVRLESVSPGWTTLFRPELDGEQGAQDLVLVVAPAVTLGGRVMDADGRPLEGATVGVPVPFGLRARFDAILDDSSTVERSVRTDELGRFELVDVPLVAGLYLTTGRPGHLTDERALPAHDELALEIVLRRADDGHLAGRVQHADGRPAEDAWVALGECSARTDAAGEFALELCPDEHGARMLRAAKRGWLPAELAAGPGDAWPAPLVLTLGSPALTISGRVLDADGAACPGAQVWTDDEQPFGRIRIEEGESSASAGATIEGILRGDPWTVRTRADAAGAFELTGLLPRDYRVHALDRRGLCVASAVLAGGTRAAELRFLAEERHARVAGRVATLDGEPLAGVRVVLARPPLRADGSPFAALESLPATTDADGRFAFEDVSRALFALAVHGEELAQQGARRTLLPGDDVERLELRVPLRAHVQVEARTPQEFDRIAVLDERGERLGLTVRHGSSSYGMDALPLSDGRTEVFSVSELAATLLLLADGAEVRRVPLALVRGELNSLRP